ncbi:MAG: DUF2263 domain-containing protein [Legionellaceae bacterium]|nr:DUF2263 domain-containing protein [Legionellaceae bacterium]MBP9774707.1 DUF2263 domain-containing protein [Legionellaceae bacterium]
MWSKGATHERFLQQLMQAHAKNSKSSSWLRVLFSGEHWRYKSLHETLKVLADPSKYQELEYHAQNNMTQWQKHSSAAPAQIDVSTQDWGTVCSAVTQQYGEPYTVLNHASDRFPGGGFLKGGSAQEENIWHRSNCALSLEEKHIGFDPSTGSFCYDNHMSQMVSAELPMNHAEQKTLAQLLGYERSDAHRVYLSLLPRICFRGPEHLINYEHVEERNGKNTIFADPDFSFQFLPENTIFPFYELRSAAPNLASEDFHFDNPKQFENYQQAIQRCIAAQLDTLILHGKKHLVLGAWGCGEFHNDPNIIAKTYRDEIYKRAHHFQHIVFAILRTASHHHINHTAFQNHLAGLPLGSKAPTISLPLDDTSNNTPRMK